MEILDGEWKRLCDAKDNDVAWRKWGPYLSERQWGTVREDYSDNGDAWNYFGHDQARSRAYHWGEDGLAGFSDDHQRLCFALALWNGKDPILKERLFGLNNSEGNHGEDVKEYYFYLDSTPTHSYMKWLYKYPQEAFPYSDLVERNRRSRQEFEYELLDTGIFNDNRYFDVVVEYAKADPEDVLIRITVINRGDRAAFLHVLPTLWFRNTWSWTAGSMKPALRDVSMPGSGRIIQASNSDLGDRWLYVSSDVRLLFTENETNNQRLFGGQNASPYAKDGINAYIVEGKSDAVNSAGTGTKAAAHYHVNVEPGQSAVIRLRLRDAAPSQSGAPFEGFDEIVAKRIEEANEFYHSLTPTTATPDAAGVMRQALAGMLWSKQCYFFDAGKWLDEHDADPFSDKRRNIRNNEWGHMLNQHVISMPDKWEYPWYAAWDLAFHTVVLSAVDVDFANLNST